MPAKLASSSLERAVAAHCEVACVTAESPRNRSWDQAEREENVVELGKGNAKQDPKLDENKTIQ